MNRACTRCGKDMKEGFVIKGGEQYYCSKKCLEEMFGYQKYCEYYKEMPEENYWTQWEKGE